MKLLRLVFIELWHRKSQLISGILAITLGIGVIVSIQSISVVSEKAVATNLDNLGANILVLPQGASIDNYYSSDIDAPTMPAEYVERILSSTLQGVDNLSPKLTRRVNVNGQEIVLTGILPKSEIAHLTTVQNLLGIKDQVSAIEIMGCCNAISNGLLSKLRNILPDTRITTIGQIVSTQIETNKLMNKVSLIFLVIILFVGGISIGNYIWANVNERRKEIGVLRMIGAKKSQIYYLLLVKASILGIIGGILGYVLGTIAALLLSPYLANLPVNPVPIFLLWSILISTCIALIGSSIPAYLAGKIDPFVNMQEV